jgi:DNA-binding MarR family transcriptional regulator
LSETADEATARTETTGESVGRLLLLASRAYSERALDLMRGRGHAGLGMTHALLLPHIDAAGTRLTVGARAGITKQAAGQTIRDLERLGYVVRTADPSDARAALVSLTERGRAFLADALAIRAQVASEFVAALGEERLTELQRILVELIEAKPFST